MSGDERWEAHLKAMREEAYAIINNDPRVLLEVDGGPMLNAHLYSARLYGFDEQVEADILIDSALPTILRPISPRLSLKAMDEPPTPSLRTAEYVMQSSYAVMKVAAEYLPKSIPYDLATFQATCLFLRYRRRN